MRPRTKDYSDLPAMLTVERAGRIAGWSRSAAYRYAAAGHLPIVRMGRRMWVVTAEFRRMLGL